MSVQADDEEFENTEMQIHSFQREEAESLHNGSSSIRKPLFSAKRSTGKSIMTLTALCGDRKNKASIGMLLSPRKETAEMAIQTEVTERMLSKKPSRDHLIEREYYKKDWEQSFVYKKAMAAEAIRRGDRVKEEFIVPEEDELGYITVTGPDHDLSAMLKASQAELPGLENNILGEDN